MFENALYRVARKRHTAPWLILQSVKDFAKYQDTEEILKSTETFMLFRHNYLDGQYIKDTTNLNQSQVDTVLNLGGTSEAKNMVNCVWLIFRQSARYSSRQII